MDLALKSSDFMEALNQQTLRVRGLEAARYTLKINGSVVGSFSREQLAEGINLAGLPTPMAKQSLGVHLLTLKRGDVHEMRWKQLQVACTTTTWRAARRPGRSRRHGRRVGRTAEGGRTAGPACSPSTN
jgi:hypothetical protein